MNLSQKEVESGLKSIAKSSVIVFLGVLSSKLLLYLYRIIIARYFGPEAYGLFSLALIIFYFFTAIATLGLADGIVRYIALFRGRKKTNEINFLFKSLLIISLVSGILFGLMLFIASGFISNNIFHDSNLALMLKIFSFALPLSIVSTIYMNTLRAHEKIISYSLNINIIQNLARVIILAVLIFFGIKSNSIAFSYVLGTGILLLSSYLFCRYLLPQIFLSSSIEKNKKKKILQEVFNYSWPIMFLSTIMSLFYWIDSFIIGYFKTVTDVGFYNSAVPIVALFALTPEIFMQLFFPLIMRQYSKDNREVINQLSKQISKWIFIFNFPFFILLILFPGAVINILFGKEYIVAENALRILSFGGLLGSFTPIFTNLLSMIGKSKTILSVIFITSIINIILNLILVPFYGLTGAAISTTISTFILWIILLISVKKHLKIIPFRRKIINILLASIIPTIILLIYRKFIPISITTLLLGVMLFCLVYFLIIILIKSLDENDYLILNAFKNRLLRFKPKNKV